MIAESLNIPKSVASRITKEDLGRRIPYYRFNIAKHMHFYSVLFLIYSHFFKLFQIYKTNNF